MEEPVMQRVKSSTGPSSRIDLIFSLDEVEPVTITNPLVDISKLESGVEPVEEESVAEPVMQAVKSSITASCRIDLILSLHEVEPVTIMPLLVEISKLESGVEPVMG